MGFANTVFVKVDVFGAFQGDGGGPVDSCFVVVVNCDAMGGIFKTEVKGALFDAEEVVDTFVGGIDFSDAGAVCCLILTDHLPGDGTTSTADNVSRKGAEFE